MAFTESSIALRADQIESCFKVLDHHCSALKIDMLQGNSYRFGYSAAKVEDQPYQQPIPRIISRHFHLLNISYFKIYLINFP